MPLYEYLCGALDDNGDPQPGCGTVTEKTCRHTERYDAPPCKACGGETHQTITKPPSFALQGGGVGWADRSYSGDGGKKTP